MMSTSHFSLDSLSQSDLALMNQNTDLNDFDDFEKHQLLNDEDDLSSDLSPSSRGDYIHQLELSSEKRAEEFSSSDENSDDKSAFPIEPSKISLPAPFMFPSLLMYPTEDNSTKTSDDVTIVDGVIYNSKGYEICGALNKFNKPCQRIGKNCPFHNKNKEETQQQQVKQIQQKQQLPASVPVISNTSSNPIVLTTTKKKLQVKKEPYKRGWTKEEHMLFLKGLQYHGKGSWKDIASIVGSRSPSQIQVHAHRYFLRQQKEKKAKRSIHDFTLNDLTEMEGKQSVPVTSTATCTTSSQSPMSLSSIVTSGPPTSQFVVPSPIFTSNGNGQLIMTSNPSINNPTVHTLSGLYTAHIQHNSPSEPTSPQHSPYEGTTSPQSSPSENSEQSTTATATTFTYLPTTATVHTQSNNGQTLLIPINQFSGTAVGWLPAGPSAFHAFTQNSQQAMLPSFIHVNQQGSLIFPQPNLPFLPQYAILPYPTQNVEDSEEEESEEEEENQFVFEQNNEETEKSESEDLMPDIFLENKL